MGHLALFGSFTIATIVAGALTGLALRSWNDEHHPTVAVPDSAVRAEINLSAVPVRGDGAGLLFAVGSVVILLALPQLRWFLLASVACAFVAGAALIAWRRHAPARC